jgi:transaldolase / glucose-6-phosphate isomerase
MTTPIDSLHNLGQSIWYDNIQRKMLENGELASMIARGELRGMTSNPSIFNQAIARSNDYDAALTSMAWAGYDAEKILDHLVIEDIRGALELFLPLYNETNGADGYVSVEVSPDLAHDSEATFREASRLWELIERPNLMVKIPATLEGLPAIRKAIAAGINVNITLIFSVDRYLKVMDAYLLGLEDRVQKGEPLDKIASVASFFISRIDNKIDKLLEELVRQEGPRAAAASGLLGKLAVANARLAYLRFREVFNSERFTRLQDQGANLQRPLWASTSTKNPAYSATKYVDELIGPDTVNTMPPQTVDAFRETGTARLTVEVDSEAILRVFLELESLGISMDEVTAQLEVEGVKAFTDAYTDLLQTVEERRLAAVRQLGSLAQAVAEKVSTYQENDLAGRIWAHEAEVWTTDAEGQREILKRLGWLDLPTRSREELEVLRLFAAEVKAAGFTHGLLLGMGGSSLAPEVMSMVFNELEDLDGLHLTILDSTDPGQVLAASNRSTVEKTLFFVSSKSGGTAEVNAFLDYFWELAQQKLGEEAGQNFVAITDPGTSLDELARERGFRRIFLADSTVGGRYSVLTTFGLAPAAAMGIDIHKLLERAKWMESQCRPQIPAGRNPGLVLGTLVGTAAQQGKDKLTLAADPALASFGSWMEQLIGESSGKQGLGIVPVDLEPIGEPGLYGEDRLFVHLCLANSPHSMEQAAQLKTLLEAGHPVISFTLQDAYDLGAEFYRWSFATAVACAVLGVNAFDQPDVQDNKNRTVAKIQSYRENGQFDESKALWEGEGMRLVGDLPGDFKPEALRHGLSDFLRAFVDQGQAGEYVALNAYIPRDSENEKLLEMLRLAIRRYTGLATTVGFGPRFLHSTGQLHKGGADNGLFIQITMDPPEDIEIPGQGLTFGTVIRAQSLGDLEALQARGRRVLRVHLANEEALLLLLKIFATF